MIIETDSFEEVAAAVWAMNPSARAHCADVAAVVTYMESMAYRELHAGPGFCATMGFMLTCYRPSWGGELKVRASVTGYLVKSFLAGLRSEVNNLAEVLTPR